MRRHGPTFASVLLAAVAVLGPSGCQSDPETVLQSDLPQVPGMAPRDSVRLQQDGSRVTGGQFSYKGAVTDLAARVEETKTRFAMQGWRLATETQTGSTAALTFTKDDRTARVEILRNGVQPGMSTAVLLVWKTDAAAGDATAASAPAATAPATNAPATNAPVTNAPVAAPPATAPK